MASSSSGGDGASNDAPLDPILAAIEAIRTITNRKGAFTKADAKSITQHVSTIENSHLTRLTEIKELKQTNNANSTTIANLKKSAADNNNNIECNNSKSYATIAASATLPSPVRIPFNPECTVRVFPVDIHKLSTSSATKQFLRTVDLKNCEACVMGMKDIRNGGVSVLLRTDREAARFEEFINEKKGKELKTEIPTKRNPTFSMLLPGLDHDIDNVVETMCFRESERPGAIKPVHSFRTKNNNTVIIIEVTPSVRQTIIENNYKSCIGWSVVTLREQTNVTQCFNCQRFGHKKNKCKHKKDDQLARRCVRCGENHDDINCTAAPTCANCTDHNKFVAKRRSGTPHLATHAANSKSCPMYLKAVERSRAYVRYDETE